MKLESISAKNHRKAWDYFISIGQIPEDHKPYEYSLHHIDETLRHTDYERYIQWNIEDLVVVKSGEHTRHHMQGNAHHNTPHSEETKQKISNSHKGVAHPHSAEQDKKIGQSNSIALKEYYKTHEVSEETRKKLSEKAKAQWAKQKENKINGELNK